MIKDSDFVISGLHFIEKEVMDLPAVVKEIPQTLDDVISGLQSDLKVS